MEKVTNAANAENKETAQDLTLCLEPINHDSENLAKSLGISEEREAELVKETHQALVKNEDIKKRSQAFEYLAQNSRNLNEFIFLCYVQSEWEKFQEQQNPLAALMQLAAASKAEA